MRNAHKDAGEMPPKMTTNDGDITSRRFTSIYIKLKCYFSCIKVSFRKKHNKHVNVDMSITSIYYSVDVNEHVKMIDIVNDFLTNLPPMKNVILCQDSNAKAEICDDVELDEHRDITLGKYGDSNKNTKGINLVNFAKNFNLKISNTWFKHKIHATWK